jgi:hypothetical protein
LLFASNFSWAKLGELGNGCPHSDYVYRRIVKVVQLLRRIGQADGTGHSPGRTVVIIQQDIQIIR